MQPMRRKCSAMATASAAPSSGSVAEPSSSSRTSESRGGGAGDEVDVGDVGGEGGEILLDGLRVADVGEDGVEDGQLGAVGRDGDSGLRHEGEQADGFQGDGFAAGVGAGDDELAVLAFQFEGDGNDRPPLRLQIALEQGMAGVVTRMSESWRLRRRGAGVTAPTTSRRRRVVCSAKRALANCSSSSARTSTAVEDRLGIARRCGAVISSRMRWISACSSSSRRTSSLFCSMVSSGSTKTVWPLELAAVDDALHAALLLDLDGDDEALAADGDQFVLHGAAFGEAAEIAAQRFLNGAALLLDLAADAGEFGRGVVVERAVGLNLVAEVAQELGEVGDAGGELRRRRVHSDLHGGRRAERDLAPLGGAIDDEDDVANLGGFESGAGDAGFLDEGWRCRAGRRSRSVHRRGGTRGSRW